MHLRRIFWAAMLCIGLALPQFSSATHVMGVDITYESIDTTGCVFRVYHNTYYDCYSSATAQLPGPAPAPLINFLAQTGCAQPVPLQTNWRPLIYHEITPICPGITTRCTNSNSTINGVLEMRYFRDYSFCNVGTGCNQYNITWSTCCRNGAITSGAANGGIYTGSTLVDLSQSPANSSPQFLYPPVPYFCAGQSFVFSQGAYDPDGDSLIYSLVSCRDSRTSAVGYNPGFSPAQPLGSSWQISIHPTTGDITLSPNPGNAAVGVVCVRVEEYRNGQKIGEVVRDMQIAAINCQSASNSPPQFDSIYASRGGTQLATDLFQLCLNDTLVLEIQSSDPDSGALTIVQMGNPLITSYALNSSYLNPNQSRFTWLPAQAGTYTIPFVTRDNHCPISYPAYRQVTVIVTDFCLDAQVTDAPCGSNAGAIDLTVNGGVSPYTFAWSNGATTEDLVNLAPGTYQVTVTDANGASTSATYSVNASNLNLNLTVTQPSCTAPTGAIAATVSGGVAPYRYNWNTGDSTATISSLPPGGYSLVVTDSTGCATRQTLLIDPPDSCVNVVRGTVYADGNRDCVQDPGEQGLPYVLVHDNNQRATSTDSVGDYALLMGTSIQRASVIPPRFYSPDCPASGDHDFSFVGYGADTSGNDFALRYDSFPDLMTRIIPLRGRSRQTLRQSVSLRNVGNVAQGGTVHLQLDSVFTFVNANNNGIYDATRHRVSWLVAPLAPQRFEHLQVQGFIDSTIALGIPFCHEAWVIPNVSPDSFPANDTSSFCDTVRNSFDPNDKWVTPRGIGERGFIEVGSTDRFSYIVRFQNTGNDTAYYVTIKDTLDSDVDPLSFQLEGFSFPPEINIDGQELTMTFANINLPDSGTNMVESQGFIAFNLALKQAGVAGTEVKNRAAIYFDFNPPIITNTVVNTFYTQPEVEIQVPVVACVGENVDAQVSQPGMPPYAYRWHDGNTQASTGIFTTDWYVVELTDAYGFTSTDSVYVEAQPLPDAAFTVQSNLSTVDLRATGSDNLSWKWNLGDGTTLQGNAVVSHTYAAGGTYTVTLETGNDCGTDNSSQRLTIDLLSVQDDRFARAVHLAPQPMLANATLTFPNPRGEVYSLRIIDLAGRTVRRYDAIRGETVELERGSLAVGTYLLRLEGTRRWTGKLVVGE